MARPDGKDRGLFERPAGSGVWWILYYDQFGDRHREKVGPKSEARKRYIQRKDEIRAYKFDPDRVDRRKLLTVDGALERYEAEMKGKNRTANRFDEHAKLWRNAFEGYALDDVQPVDVERWKLAAAEKSQPATVNRHLSFLRRLFTLAVRDRVALRSPFPGVSLLQENNIRIRYLLEAEEKRLKGKMDPTAWRLVEIAFMTGLRQAEQFELLRVDVNFESGFLTVPRSKHGLARHVPIGPTVANHLRQLLASHESRWAFPSEKPSSPLLPNNFVRRHFVPAMEEAKIENLHWHDLRHTYASRLVMKGVDIYQVKELMGHKDIRTTMRYAHLAPGYHHQAIALLEPGGGECEPQGTTSSEPTATQSATTVKKRARKPRQC